VNPSMRATWFTVWDWIVGSAGAAIFIVVTQWADLYGKIQNSGDVLQVRLLFARRSGTQRIIKQIHLFAILCPLVFALICLVLGALCVWLSITVQSADRIGGADSIGMLLAGSGCAGLAHSAWGTLKAGRTAFNIASVNIRAKRKRI
jgi:hypothetical protein